MEPGDKATTRPVSMIIMFGSCNINMMYTHTLSHIHTAESDSWRLLWSANLQSLCKYMTIRLAKCMLVLTTFSSMVSVRS